MSLYRIALRAATVLAIKGRTQAGEHVYDSRNDPLEEIVAGVAVPIIAVYTEEDKNTHDSRELALVIEFTVNIRERGAPDAGTVVPAGNGRDGEDAVWVPQTDDGLEITLDIIEQEIRDALEGSTSEAADIWNTLVIDIRENSSKRGVLDPQKTNRLAARQLLLRVKMLKDPKVGAPIPQVLERLLKLLEADYRYSPTAPMLRNFAERQAGQPVELQDMARLQLDRSSAQNIRITKGETLQELNVHDR
jgi:hypothetical protein